MRCPVGDGPEDARSGYGADATWPPGSFASPDPVPAPGVRSPGTRRGRPGLLRRRAGRVRLEMGARQGRTALCPGDAEDEIGELGCGEAGIAHLEESALLVGPKGVGDDVDASRGRLLEVGAGEVGEPFGFRDDQPPQRQDIRPEDAVDVAAGQVGEDGPQVGGRVDLAVTQHGREVGDDRLGVAGHPQHNLPEELFFVRELLVDGLLGHRGVGSDLVHGGAPVAVTQEQRRRGLHDGQAFPGRPPALRRRLVVPPGHLRSGTGAGDGSAWHQRPPRWPRRT